MRRRTALLYTLSLFPLSAAAFAIACGGDDNGGVHGEVFGPDGSTLGDGGNLGDGTFAEPDGNVTSDGGDAGPACTTGTIAIVGGGASSSFASVSTGKGAFTTQNFASTGMAALPAVIAFGSGFQGVFHTTGSNALMSTGYASPTWSAPAVISGTLVREMPSLAVEGSTLHMVYQANDDAGVGVLFKYFHGTFASSWTAGDPVETATQSDGPHAPGLAGLASELVLGQVGGDSNIYARSFTTAWQDPVEIEDGGIASTQGDNTENKGTAARIVALTGGAAELLLVYTRLSDVKLMALTRTSGTWQTAPTLIDTNDYTTEPFNLAALPGGKAIVSWRGSNTFGYASVYNGTSWSTPATALTTFAINSAPAITVGDCGSVAVAAYAKAAGTVEMIRYDGTSWGTAQAVTGASNATFVAIAATP